MAKITDVLKDVIRKTSRREINAGLKATRRLVARQRRDLAAIKRQMVVVLKELGAAPARQHSRPAPAAKTEETRFRADGLKSHRAKLGLSAQHYAKLLDVSPMTIYSWEARRSRPRKAQLAKLALLRKLSKKEILAQFNLVPANSTTISPASTPQDSPAPSLAEMTEIPRPLAPESPVFQSDSMSHAEPMELSTAAP